MPLLEETAAEPRTGSASWDCRGWPAHSLGERDGQVSAAAEDGCGTGRGTPGAGAALPWLVVSPHPVAGERGGVLAPGP
ncbi:hypothetical protein NDU88_001119 [Pleurodeles waltl]|uniref:Uncharacterized protein n=1 Tax=Pleurodeles waltl TaxID=8319 RepID=A0AAV7SC31_PLEWA|nr:hypothetical protein NDU88_001119 [Pleurodeles waltl]